MRSSGRQAKRPAARARRVGYHCRRAPVHGVPAPQPSHFRHDPLILERYLFREVLQTFVGVFGVLVLIFMSHRFVQYLAEAASGELASELIFELMALKLVANLMLIMPLAYFLAVLMAFSRLYSDSEVTAFVAGGISPARLMGALAVLSAVVGLVALVLSAYVGPEAQTAGDALEDRAQEESDISGIISGRFKEFGTGRRVFFAREVSSDRSELLDVFVQRLDGERPVLIKAESGYELVDPATRDRFMVMVNGHSYEGRPGEADIAVTEFREYGVRIEDNPVRTDSRRLNQVPTLELLATPGPEAAAELQWRLSLPLSVVLLGPLGVLVARTSPRQGRFARLFYGILVYFIYNNLLGVGRELVRRGELDPLVGVWPVHLAMVLLIGALYAVQVSGRRPPAVRLWRRRAA